MRYIVTLFIFLASISSQAQNTSDLLQGAWQSEGATITFSGNYFSYVEFDLADKSFKGTRGGSWSKFGSIITLKYEFDTWNKEKVGTDEGFDIQVTKKKLRIAKQNFKRIDKAKPGKLHGAWLITGRMRDGEIQERDPNRPRKTMKILSGTRFQWIAYNTKTKEFMGTGGGSYTTKEGKYTENIEFFSRDSTRVGASLNFKYELKDGKWHHSGKSSKGNSIYEVWSQREE